MLNQNPARCALQVIATVIVAALLAAAASDACAQPRNVTWIGGSGFWDVNNNWNDGSIHPLQPFSPDAVFIPSGTPEIRFLEDVNTLDVDPGAGIAMNSVLGVHNGVVNDGVITVGPNGQFAVDVGALGGSGVVVLTDSTGTNAAFQGAPNGGNPCCVTHAATHTIRGEGSVFGKLVNDGLIRGEETSGDSTAVLTISGTMTNNGVIRSSATGTIQLDSLTLTMGAAGQFIADGQSIQLGAATTIIGGSISAINGAKFVRNPNAGGTTVFSGVTINGDLDVLVNNAGVAGTGAGITNNGTITLDNLGVGNGEFYMDAGSTLDGTGQLVLNRANDSTHLSGNFTHGASHTIRGVGRIHATIVNNGSILAEPKNGGTLLRMVDNAITNNNLIQANSGATLRMEQASITQDAAGRIRAADGGRVELQNFATVNGGKLQTAGTGLIVDASASILNNVTNEGNFHVLAGSTTRVNATLINNGTITVNPTGVAGFTAIEFSSDTVLSGTGTIVLNQTGNNARITSAQSNQDITQAAGHTIRGVGWINNGWFGDGKFINHGRLEGNSATELLELSTRLSGSGTLKNVLIDGFGASHTLGEAGTTAIVAVEGLYNFGVGSTMLADLAGATPGAGYDQLNSTGVISLQSNTRLEVSLAGGFLPQPGQSFTLLTTTGSLTGAFGTVVLPTLPLGLSWNQTQTANSFSIMLSGSLAADFNNDLRVNSLDLGIWKTGFGTGTTHAQGDADADGDVDGNDFLVWQRSLGWGVPSLVVTKPVPEPASALLIIVAAAALARRQGQRYPGAA